MSSTVEIPDYIKLIYLFGLAGAGKNYVADLLGREFKIKVYHADADLTDEMKEAISEKRQFTDEMRDEYFNVVAGVIERNLTFSPRLIVTQATYKARHRKMLEDRFPGIFFIWIDAPEDEIVKRLRSRGDDVTPDYAQKMRINFESPDDSVPRLVNRGTDKDLLDQLELIFQKFA